MGCCSTLIVRPAIRRTRAISSALFSLGVSHSLVPSLYELMRWSLAVTEFKSFSGMAAWCLRPIIAVPGSAALYFRSEEHTSELQSLMRISYAVFCLKKKKRTTKNNTKHKQKD